MTRTTTLFLAAAMLTLAMAACSVMAYPDKQQGPGPCASGYYPDDRGCCPAIIQGKPYYRDSNKCYPVGVGAKGVLYADSFGYRYINFLVVRTSTNILQRSSSSTGWQVLPG
jgi:hypothetical protein